jgi:Asp-tRNA(Asn)/Glu-tRNA(Gln) amidotransferase A subunit family amidase
MTPDAKDTLTGDLLDATRRRFLSVSTAAGVAGTLFPGVLLAIATQSREAEAQRHGQTAEDTSGYPPITDAMIEQAAALAGLKFTEEQRKTMMSGLISMREGVAEVRKMKLPNAVAPCLVFNPVPPGAKLETERKPIKLSPAPSVTGLSLSEEDKIAFATVRQLAELLRTRKVTSTELTKMYIARLKRYDPKLHFVITLTEERALKQAAEADKAIAAGKHRGPLHGVPWGAKDLLAVKGYRTTWGAGGFEQQSFDYDAEVVKRLDAAGAVLIAKLSMGALAQNDGWFGGRTRNPWNTEQGSSGSSAGSASAASAGCVGFAIGTETQGSISSPSTRCGVTGLRPSFGLVPRTGAMALSWSMDKIGPITRSVEDCAIVLDAIYGQDGHDLSVQAAAFNPDFSIDIRKLRVGYIKSSFDEPTAPTGDGNAQRKTQYERGLYDYQYARKALETLRGMGINLQPMELPKFPFSAVGAMLGAEAAAAFDDLLVTGRVDLLTGQTPGDWPNQFRTSQMYTAVEYINASRARTVALAQMTEAFAPFDVVVTTGQGAQTAATNLCGQPAVIVPNGLRGPDAPEAAAQNGSSNGGPNTPVSLTFLAPLYQDAKACALAHAYQVKTGFHLLHPKLD